MWIHLLELGEFLVDLLCMMPEIGEISWIAVPPSAARVVFFIGVGVVAVALLAGCFRAILLAVGIVVVVTLIVINTPQSAQLLAPYLAIYSAMIIATRFVEGAVLGSGIRTHFRVWQVPTLLVFMVVAYFTLVSIDARYVSIAKATWALLGAIWASASLARPMFTRGGGVGGLGVAAGCFITILATVLFIQGSQLEALLFQWLFPVGLVVGLVIGPRIRKDGRPTHSDGSSSPT